MLSTQFAMPSKFSPAKIALASLIGGATRDGYRYAKRRLTRRNRYKPRGYRRWKRARYSRRRRKYIGYPVRYGTAKRTLVSLVADQTQSTRTLYSQDLTYIGHTDSNEVNKRQRDIINLRGFRINIQFQRDITATSRDLILHLAVIHDKGRADAALTATNPIQTEDFFRGNSTNRAIDFQNTLAGIEFNNLGINTDLYTVLAKKDYYMKSSAQDGRSSFRRKLYIKVNRQIRYDNEVGGTNEEVATDGRCFLVWWYEIATGQGASATPIAVGAHDRMCVTYWREPPC